VNWFGNRHARPRPSTAASSTARASRFGWDSGSRFFSTVIGLAIGLVTGFSRPVDAIVMRIMDG